MFSQLLLGENLSVVESENKWRRCQLSDGNSCWLHQSSLAVGEWLPANPAICKKPITKVWHEPEKENDPLVHLSFGTIVDLVAITPNYCAVQLANQQHGFIEADHLAKIEDKPNPDQIISDSLLFLDIPYLWGGTTGFGLDCSGLVKLTFAAQGIALPRNASQQATHGVLIEKDSLQAADLVFFSEGGNIDHVGIYLGDGDIIHAGLSNGAVKIEPLDSPLLANIFHSARRLFS
jgi:hypothetical protein